MGIKASSPSMSVIVVLLSAFAAAGASAATFTIKNNCSYTVWPAATPVGGGKQLSPGQTWTLNNCSFNDAGHGHCRMGDCAGALSCTNNTLDGGLRRNRRLGNTGAGGSGGSGDTGGGGFDTGSAGVGINVYIQRSPSIIFDRNGSITVILAAGGGANDDKYGISLVDGSGYNLPMDFSCSTGGVNDLHCGGPSCPDANKTHGCRGNSNYKATFCP